MTRQRFVQAPAAVLVDFFPFLNGQENKTQVDPIDIYDLTAPVTELLSIPGGLDDLVAYSPIVLGGAVAFVVYDRSLAHAMPKQLYTDDGPVNVPGKFILLWETAPADLVSLTQSRI